MPRASYDSDYKFQYQDFYAIRDNCLRRGYLFEDPYFKLDSSYEWLRPWEVTNNPQLYVGGIARFDVIQGELGDCWMLASISALGKYPLLVRKIIPSDQSFDSNYAGVFHFRIWQFGRWNDVVIDDRLPTRDGQLVYTKSVSSNEFWSALLEKAYCKVLGGRYKVADAGNLCEALEDFTGGVVEQHHLSYVPRNFSSIMLKAVSRNSLMGCFIDNDPGTSEGKTPDGLIKGHSYSVTGATSVKLPGSKSIVLVRVRNPWGQHEWTGPWSDGSPEWRNISQRTKQELQLVDREDGEFWMSYSDFVSNFQWIDMVHLTPEAFSDAYGEVQELPNWGIRYVRGRWVKGVSAGGDKYFHTNPQIRFTLYEADDDNEDGYCNILIALLQKTSGAQGDQLEIGFKVYEITLYTETPLAKTFFQMNRPVAEVETKGVREVAGRFNLEPGTYIIVPYTQEVGGESEFMMRLYTEKSSDMDEVDSRIGISPPDIAMGANPPMRVGDKKTEDKKTIEGEIKTYFEKVSGADKEVDWRGVKDILEYMKVQSLSTNKDEVSKDEVSSGLGMILIGTTTKLYNRFFNKKPVRKLNAFLTVSSEGFSSELCRSMVALLDIDHSGKLGKNEFQDLISDVVRWKNIYEEFSKDDGFLTSSKLKYALAKAGIQLNRKTLTDVVHRYSSDGKIPFDDFLHCAIKVKRMAEIFKSYQNKSQKAEFMLDEFIDKVLYS